jgi:hypothetical protein
MSAEVKLGLDAILKIDGAMFENVKNLSVNMKMLPYADVRWFCWYYFIGCTTPLYNAIA